MSDTAPQRKDFRFTERHRVRWAEVDMQAIVFNGHYLMYFDTAVAGYWRALALPYHDTMQALGKAGLHRVDVMCPGFVADCLETLEEIAIENQAAFLGAGGGEFRYIPCLNERDDWVQSLAEIVAGNLLGWTDSTTHESLEMSRLRALQMGAKS